MRSVQIDVVIPRNIDGIIETLRKKVKYADDRVDNLKEYRREKRENWQIREIKEKQTERTVMSECLRVMLVLQEKQRAVEHHARLEAERAARKV